ncbi:MarR family transcriptional regulator [Actinoplanes sp. NPDC049596]|uniref:MarR family winged helix-turn-helix transcriptional regulator n=1 Tax=unclassified Actinoplanes TaxID=2626549 RepID=UPI00343340EE
MSTRELTEAEIIDATRRMIASAVLFSHKVADELRLGPSDAQFMTLLDVHGPLTPGRFAELTGLKTGTVTGVLDRLESAGLVRRDRDPHDRRKVIVSPVEAAVDDRVRPRYAAQADHMRSLLSRYSTQELATIADFMRVMTGGQ